MSSAPSSSSPLLRCRYAQLLGHWHKHVEKHGPAWEWARGLECLGRFSPRADGPWELACRGAEQARVLREHRRELAPPALDADFAPERHLTAYRLWLEGHAFDEAGCGETRRAAGLCRYIFVACTLLGLDPPRAWRPPRRLAAFPLEGAVSLAPPSGVLCLVHPGWARPDCAGWVPLERCRLAPLRRHRYVFGPAATAAAARE